MSIRIDREILPVSDSGDYVIVIVFGLAREDTLVPISPSPKRGLFPTHGALGPSVYHWRSPLFFFPSPTLFKTPSPPVDMSTAELACSYAALILADDGIEVSVRISNSVKLVE
jgi:hypothetical protein